MENATAGSEASRSTEGALRISPASAGSKNAAAGGAASRSTEGALSPNPEDLSQRTCELRKASCKHRSASARAFLSQAMPGPKTLPLQVGMLYNSRLLTCRSAHQSITIVLPSTCLPTRQSIQSCFPAVCRPAHQSIHLCCPANEKAWIRNSSVGQHPAACCAISLTALAVMRISRSVL